jgi:hypothetical protein
MHVVVDKQDRSDVDDPVLRGTDDELCSMLLIWVSLHRHNKLANVMHEVQVRHMRVSECR